MPTTERSALALGLGRCPACGLLARAGAGHARCPRCGEHWRGRKPQSLARTVACMAAAYVLFIPANLLPVMHSVTLKGEKHDTILSGVLHLWNTGSWPLALIVFVASIVVPLTKLLILTLLVVSVARRAPGWPFERTRLYRVIEYIGRWSMLDIYVVTVLAALVQLQAFATVDVGPGALPFAGVVVLTMLASRSFDPRLIWDHAEENHA